jgi:hypothetical protein
LNSTDTDERKAFSVWPLLAVYAIAALVAFACAALVPDRIVGARVTIELCQAIAHYAPSVTVMSAHSLEPMRIQFIWAIQWLFFPIYILVWYITATPWSPEMCKAARVQAETLSRAHNATAIVGIVVSLVLILSDFGIIDGVSFLRGTLFEVNGDISNLPLKLREPFMSTFSMVFYAWVIPSGNAWVYWMLVYLVVNSRLFIGKAITGSVRP